MSERRNVYRRILIASVAIALNHSAMAGSVYLLTDVERLSLPVNVTRLETYSHNPATMAYRDSVSMSGMSISALYDRQGKPLMEQLGDGSNLMSLSASSYTRLDSMRTVWGDATFTTGEYRSVRWTDCIDYLRVAPYVLGDEAGGNLHTRRYEFDGGYSQRLGRWSLGVEAAYRAEVAFRNHDPRVKTVVSDLDIAVGGSYKATATHVVGFKAAFNLYNQNCDIDFYNPLNDINTYPLTGMGTYYLRFMGNANKSSGHSSSGYGLGLQWLPVAGNGLTATVDVGRYRMNQMLRSYNNITLGFTDNTTASLSANYRIAFGATIFQPEINARLLSRKGTENLFGAAGGMSYNKIGSQTPYSYDNIAATLRLPVQITAGASHLTVIPMAGYDYSDESYTDPRRKLTASHIIPGAEVDFSSTRGPWLWQASAGGAYAKSCNIDEILTGLDDQSSLKLCVTDNFSMLKADKMSLNARVSVAKVLRNYILGVTLNYDFSHYTGEASCNRAGVELWVKF